MVESRRRRSLLGLLALGAGLAALVLIRFNPTAVQTVNVGPVVLRLGTALALGASAVALLAFVMAASSARTGTGTPLLALLVCACALLLVWKPTLFTPTPKPPAVKPAAVSKPAPPAAPAPAAEGQHRSKLFDMDSTSAEPSAAKTEAGTTGVHAPRPVPPRATPAARPDPLVALRAARAKLDAARARVATMLGSSPAFQSAKEEADAADAELKKARMVYQPGSPELIAVSRSALAARDKVQAMISDAALRDPAYLDAARELKDAEAAK